MFTLNPLTHLRLNLVYVTKNHVKSKVVDCSIHQAGILDFDIGVMYRL
jgi:hypothetical protein